MSFPGDSVVKNLPANAGDTGDEGLIPGWRRSPGGGHSNPLQNSYRENPMDRGAWWATVQEVAKIQTRLKRPSTYLTTVLVSLKNEDGSTWIETIFYIDEKILH